MTAGMGLNAFFTSIAPTCPGNSTGDINGVVCPTWGKSTLPWSDAMGAVLLSGGIYLILTFTGLRTMLFRAVPQSLRSAITVGIGFFITIIGLKIGQITKVELASWAVSNVVNLGECVTDSNGSIQFCSRPIDLYFTWYSYGMKNFVAGGPTRIGTER